MATLISTMRNHLPNLDVEIMITEWHVRGKGISDGAAVTIAGWWQSNSVTGMAFAQLASLGMVEYQELQDAIAAHYDEAKRQGPDATRELDALATWAMNHPSRGLDRTHTYVADNPIPPHLITPGLIVSVPEWVRSRVERWVPAEVRFVERIEGAPFYRVRLQDGREIGYFAYSIGHP